MEKQLVAATPALEAAWTLVSSTGKLLGTKGPILIVEVADEYTAKAVERMNLYPFESFVKMHRAGFYFKRVSCRVAVAA